MQLRSLILALSFAVAALPAAAQTRPVVVELFTSQGCSSCPPADALLGEIGSRQDVIALAYHVDYWDYLGWQDTFARPEFTARQTGYADEVNRKWIGRKLRGSFTPEAVIQGSDSLVGSNRKGIEARIAAHQAQPALASVALGHSADGRIVAKIAPAAGAGKAPESILFVATYLPSAKVMVERGENAGQELGYSHVVTSLTRYARWDGTGTVELPLADGIMPPLVAILQQGENGPILAAARLE